jgi:hypothetical protein
MTLNPQTNQTEREIDMLTIKVMNEGDFGYKAFHVHDYDVQDRPDGRYIGMDAYRHEANGEPILSVRVQRVAYVVNEVGKTVDTVYPIPN